MACQGLNADPLLSSAMGLSCSKFSRLTDREGPEKDNSSFEQTKNCVMFEIIDIQLSFGSKTISAYKLV
jgi:hypothetical protein